MKEQRWLRMEKINKDVEILGLSFQIVVTMVKLF